MTKLHQWNVTFSIKELFVSSRDSLSDLLCAWLLVKLLWLVAFRQVKGWYHCPAYWPASLLENADFHSISQLSLFSPPSPFAWMPQSAKHPQSSPPCLLQLKLFTGGTIALKLMAGSHWFDLEFGLWKFVPVPCFQTWTEILPPSLSLSFINPSSCDRSWLWNQYLLVIMGNA